jgi:predicted nucleic acid-binding protein
LIGLETIPFYSVDLNLKRRCSPPSRLEAAPTVGGKESFHTMEETPPRPTMRLYLDTSVFGGCFDEEFSEASNRLFETVREGAFRVVVSRTTIDELNRAPEHVRHAIDALLPGGVEYVEPAPEIDRLCEAYLQAGVVGASSRNDASHIAAASVARVDTIVSWNFKHIVHFEKIRGYHGVNLLHEYGAIPIHAPPEVI